MVTTHFGLGLRNARTWRNAVVGSIAVNAGVALVQLFAHNWYSLPGWTVLHILDIGNAKVTGKHRHERRIAFLPLRTLLQSDRMRARNPIIDLRRITVGVMQAGSAIFIHEFLSRSLQLSPAQMAVRLRDIRPVTFTLDAVAKGRSGFLGSINCGQDVLNTGGFLR
jgi:hypothetical protein